MTNPRDGDEHDEKGAEPEFDSPSGSEVHLFAEEAEVRELIARLLPVEDGDGSNDDEAERPTALHSRQLSALARLRSIFDSYLECPTLLDQSLEEMVTKIANQVRALIEEENENLQMDEAASASKKAPDGDAVLALRCHLSVLYGLSKVRGRKIVQRFLPHDVDDVEPVWDWLVREMMAAASAASENAHASNHDDAPETPPGLPQRWESIYVLWNWTSVLSLVPFDCSVVARDDQFAPTLVLRAKECLSEAGPIREAAASCLAAWISRVDLEATELPSFVGWSLQVVEQYRSRPSSPSGLFQMLGILQTLTTVLKQSAVDRAKLVTLLRPLWDAFLSISSGNAIDSNLLLRKLLIKWWTRMGCAFLPPARIAPWRYQRGNRSLQISSSAKPPPQSDQRDGTPSIESATSESVDAVWEVIDPVEDGMGRLIESLGHSSTVVRWSAAKGIGRVAERLPAALCAEDVLDAVLSYFDDKERDNCWHGACLALAEMARRGLLMPSRLGDVVPRIVAAIQYDVPRGHKSVGAHVRDAACYTYWAFARAYSPAVLRPYIRNLNDAIILTSLFDREVNCRRAASAAFQEAVGRQGATSFPNGIAILTCADYFSLGNRKDAYTIIAKTIAGYDEYRQLIIRHLFSERLAHWDPSIRELSSKALALLTELDPGFVGEVAVPYLLDASLDPVNMNKRHGAVLGVAELTLALSRSQGNLNDMLPSTVVANLVSLAPTIEKRRLYRGRGGENMRTAVCRLVECIAKSNVPLSTQEQVQLLDCVDGCIAHPSNAIQVAACQALEQLMSQYFPVRETGPTPRLQARVVDKFVQQVQESDNPGATRGYALALGYLPAKLLAPRREVLDSVLDCLCKAARYDSLVGGESDAETRRNALHSLRRVSETVGLGCQSQQAAYPTVQLEQSQVQRLFDSYQLALRDYKSDKRGDVGCWCRMEALEGIAVLMQLLSDNNPANISISCETITRLVAEILRQASEQLDTVRRKAGDCLDHILRSSYAASRGDGHEKLLQALRLDSAVARGERPWGDPHSSFSMVLKAASVGVDEYFSQVIAGLAMSVGGLTKSVSNAASAALQAWLDEVNDTNYPTKLAMTLLELLRQSTCNIRVSLPTIRTLQTLFKNCFLRRLPSHQQGRVAERCVRTFLETERHADDVHRLHALVDATASLLEDDAFIHQQSDATAASAHGSALAFLCRMLAHKYPRVRTYTAENLYVLVIDDRVGVKSSPASIDLILETPWASTTIDGGDFSCPSQRVAIGLGVQPAWDAMRTSQPRVAVR